MTSDSLLKLLEDACMPPRPVHEDFSILWRIWRDFDHGLEADESTSMVVQRHTGIPGPLMRSFANEVYHSIDAQQIAGNSLELLIALFASAAGYGRMMRAELDVEKLILDRPDVSDEEKLAISLGGMDKASLDWISQLSSLDAYARVITDTSALDLHSAGCFQFVYGFVVGWNYEPVKRLEALFRQ
jgi:hypothetical protein